MFLDDALGFSFCQVLLLLDSLLDKFFWELFDNIDLVGVSKIYDGIIWMICLVVSLRFSG